MKEQTVGMVGLGIMGSAMSANLARAGFRVAGFDVAPRRRTEHARSGGVAARSPREVARTASPSSSIAVSPASSPTPNLGVIRQRIGTEPVTPSTRRTSSNQGRSPPWSSVIASVRRTVPRAVTNVVCSTLELSTYSRSTRKSISGASSNAPPRA